MDKQLINLSTLESSYVKIKTYIDTSINSKVNPVIADIESINTFLDLIESTITIDQYKTSIKKSIYGLDVATDKISFTENDSEIMNIQSSKVNITDVSVSNSFSMGNFQLILQEGGGATLVWLDDGEEISGGDI